jgi:hypothetical protein
MAAGAPSISRVQITDAGPRALADRIRLGVGFASMWRARFSSAQPFTLFARGGVRQRTLNPGVSPKTTKSPKAMFGHPLEAAGVAVFERLHSRTNTWLSRVAPDRLAVDRRRRHPQPGQGLADERIALGPIETAPGEKADPAVRLARDQPVVARKSALLALGCRQMRGG